MANTELKVVDNDDRASLWIGGVLIGTIDRKCANQYVLNVICKAYELGFETMGCKARAFIFNVKPELELEDGWQDCCPIQSEDGN